eukprot:7961943-Alexandrium_andersonii.AAC.3
MPPCQDCSGTTEVSKGSGEKRGVMACRAQHCASNTWTSPFKEVSPSPGSPRPDAQRGQRSPWSSREFPVRLRGAPSSGPNS